MEEKRYYRIKDAAEFLNEAPSTLRFWETEFKELEPGRSMKGRRLYTPKDIETLKIIKYLLRTKGMHIAMAKEQLRLNRKNLARRTQALDELYSLRDSLKLLMKSLNKIRD